MAFASKGFTSTRGGAHGSKSAPKSPSPAPSAGADPGEDMESEDPIAQYHQSLNDQHHEVHKHLRAAHAAAGSSIARQHINLAGMAATKLHKTAKAKAGAEGAPGDEYSQESNGGYSGNGN